MPAVQGHITVRRRAKDGTNGADAVRYWVVPSATQIKRSQDGTINPATVTCEKRKQTGNAAPVATTEGILYYKIGNTNGTVSGKTTYVSTGVNATINTAWIQFMLEVSQVEVASETVSVVADGRSVSGVKEWYLRWAQSSGVTTNTGGWSETVPQLTQTYKYLWNYEEISFDDGTTVKTQPAIIGVYGRGIKSVTNYYLATSSSSGVTTTTAGWTTNVQSPTPEKRYLWNYEVVTYDDDSTTTTSPHIICVYGEKGDPGDPGNPGAPGEDGYTIIVSPSNLTFNYDTPVLEQKVRVDVYKGNRKLTYSTEYLCSTLSTKNSITDGLNWGSNTDDNGFYYKLTYLSNRDVNIDIPFVITIGDLKFNRVICVKTIKNGIPGPTYKPLRVREWSKLATGTQLTTGLADTDQWTDIVYKLNSSIESGVEYWRCIKAFTKTANQQLPDSSDQYLQKTSNFGSLATDIFLANYALIKNLGVETIDMRDSAGNVLFQAKNGVVTCNTGNFSNVDVNGGIKAQTLELQISTRDHNGDTSYEPNGSICLNADRLSLPALSPGAVRTIRVLNPLETRTAPNDLILSRGSTSVRISPSLSALSAVTTDVTLAECGMNGGVYLELLGYRKANSSTTYWLTKKLANVT